MEKHFDSILFRALSSLATDCNWEEMQSYLEGLSHSRFRTASYILAERILPQLSSEAYWECFATIAAGNAKVYLVTFLKAALTMYQAERLLFSDQRFIDFASRSVSLEHSLDRQKSLRMIIPQLKTHNEIHNLLTAFCGEDGLKKLNYLIHTDESTVAYYSIFQLLRQMDLPVEELINAVNLILKRSTPLAYNFASIVREYFDIRSMRGQFSLTLQPYELSRLENNYDIFMQTLTSMR